VGHQRTAAHLAARIGAQLSVERSDLRLERVDHRDRDRDLLARRRGQRLLLEPRSAVARHQLAPLRAAVVIERRLNALLPLAALIAKRVAQPDPCAQIEQVVGRDPRLGQPRDHHQLAQVPGVRAI
jgi:hypothetical protein